eukprot:scaffold17122_cov113-Isochrysis_galbana.AAC.5
MDYGAVGGSRGREKIGKERGHEGMYVTTKRGPKFSRSSGTCASAATQNTRATLCTLPRGKVSRASRREGARAGLVS